MAKKPTKKQDRTIILPPFPLLRWDSFFWQGSICLKSWVGFQSRGGPYDSKSSDKVSDGTVSLIVTKEERREPPSPEQAKSFQHLLDNEATIRDAVLKAILDQFADWREPYGADAMPAIKQPDELKQFVGLSIVHVLETPKDGLTCVGFEMGCDWDPEHGLGVLTHDGKVIEVAEASVAFQDYFADDGGEPESEYADKPTGRVCWLLAEEADMYAILDDVIRDGGLIRWPQLNANFDATHVSELERLVLPDGKPFQEITSMTRAGMNVSLARVDSSFVKKLVGLHETELDALAAKWAEKPANPLGDIARQFLGRFAAFVGEAEKTGKPVLRVFIE